MPLRSPDVSYWGMNRPKSDAVRGPLMDPKQKWCVHRSVELNRTVDATNVTFRTKDISCLRHVGV